MPGSMTAEAGAGGGVVLPEPGEVWTWWVDLDVAGEAARDLTTVLAEDERERAARFRFETHRRRFIAGRVALRQVLGGCLGVAAKAVAFQYGDHGRPELAPPFDGYGLRFNASHSDRLGVVAMVRDQRIGVDVERIRSLRDLERIAERTFSAGENRALRRLPVGQVEAGFFHCWTRKEAVVKALGTGIYHGLDRFTVTLAPGEPARLVDAADAELAGERWTLDSLLPPAAGFAAALAVDRPVLRVVDRSGEQG